MTPKEMTTEELIAELRTRENVYCRDIIPCEHYRIDLRGHLLRQGIGFDDTKIILIDGGRE